MQSSKINIQDPDGSEKFINEDHVLKVTDPTGHIRGMVITFADYAKKAKEYNGISIMHTSSLVHKLAYIYGKTTSIFWLRKIGTTDWVEWFDT